MASTYRGNARIPVIFIFFTKCYDKNDLLKTFFPWLKRDDTSNIKHSNYKKDKTNLADFTSLVYQQYNCRVFVLSK